jgi:GAF domain-containing protein
MDEAIGSDLSVALDEMRRIEAITDVALGHIRLDAMMPELLDRVRDTLDVDTVAVLLLDPAADELVAFAAKGIEEEVEAGIRIPLGRGFAGRIAAERRAVVIEDIATADVLNPLLRQKGITSLLGVPLLVDGALLGVLHVGSLAPRSFDADESRLLELAAARIGPAIAHARLYDAERTAREEAEQALEELRALQSLTDAALTHLDLDEMLLESGSRSGAALRAASPPSAASSTCPTWRTPMSST